MNRLDTYRLKTEPLIGFYRAEGSLKSFLSLSSRDTVAEIGKALSVLK